MAITPIDIYNKEFDKTRKGYNAEQVDVFLDEIVESFENLYKLNISLKEKNEVLVEKLNNYRAIETALNKTLNTAEVTAKDIIDNAQNKSELLVQEAQIKAKKIVQEAEVNASQIVQGAEEKTISARRELEELKRQVGIYKNRMVAVLEAQLKSIVGDYQSILDDNPRPVMEKRLEPEIDKIDVEELVVNQQPEETQQPLAIVNDAFSEVINEVADEQPVDEEVDISQPSFTIDNGYFNFQEEETQSSDDGYTLPQNKQLAGTYFGIEEKQVEPEQKIESDNPVDDYIQIDYANPESLTIEQEEEEEEEIPKDNDQGYSLEDAFLELRRAAEIYKDSSQDNQLS